MIIAITGIGIVSALGIGQNENCRRLLDGCGAVCQPVHLPTSHREWPIGEVALSNSQLTDNLGLTGMTYTRDVLLGLLALKEALDDANLSEEERKETSLIDGSTVGGMDITESHYADWLAGEQDTLHLIKQHEVNFTTNELVRRCNLKRGVTVSTACSSALNAIIHGAGLLRSGVESRVVVGGTEAMTKFHLNGFASLGIISHSVCRPFQEGRDGINLGEGAAYLVLENVETAHDRNAKIYGYLAGYGNSCDAYHQTASSPDGDGAFSAMSEALSMGNITPCQVDYINAHGTATPNNDASELRAFERLFSNTIPYFESTKPLTGHTTSASGSIEAIFSLFRLQEGNYGYALCNAFGFGGNDSSIIVSREPVSLPTVRSVDNIHSTSLYISIGELDYKLYIPSIQSRRMTPMMRQLIVVAKQAMNEAGINIPDGIIVGTRFGGMAPTLQLLKQLTEYGECDFSPALFMNSTHNCAAGTLARFFNCKGYNNTIVTSEDTLTAAIEDAKLAFNSFAGIKNILVCSFDEVDSEWRNLMNKAGMDVTNGVKAQLLWLD